MGTGRNLYGLSLKVLKKYAVWEPRFLLFLPWWWLVVGAAVSSEARSVSVCLAACCGCGVTLVLFALASAVPPHTGTAGHGQLAGRGPHRRPIPPCGDRLRARGAAAPGRGAVAPGAPAGGPRGRKWPLPAGRAPPGAPDDRANAGRRWDGIDGGRRGRGAGGGGQRRGGGVGRCPYWSHLSPSFPESPGANAPERPGRAGQWIHPAGEGVVRAVAQDPCGLQGESGFVRG